MIPLLKTKRKPTKFERSLWLGVGLISLLPLFAVLAENPANLLTDFRMGLFAFFAGIATIGWLLNWGPVVPSSILGITTFTFLTSPVSSSHEAAVFNLLGVPLIGATLGSMIGLLIDWNLAHSPRTDSNSDERGDGPSDENPT